MWRIAHVSLFKKNRIRIKRVIIHSSNVNCESIIYKYEPNSKIIEADDAANIRFDIEPIKKHEVNRIDIQIYGKKSVLISRRKIKKSIQ